MPTCKGCGAEILWVKVNGKAHPVNPKRAMVVIEEKVEAPGPGELYGRAASAWVSHFATCPMATQFRRRKED
jgi:hypothetical protein